MGLIKKHYRAIISYSLIVIGVIIFIAILIIKPQQTFIKDADQFSKKDAETTKVELPFVQEYTLTASNPPFLEIYLGKDTTILDYNFQLSVKKDGAILFSHDYIHELSNIIRVPLPEDGLSSGDILTITFSSSNTSEVKLETYGNDNLKILEANRRDNLSYCWYGVFAIVVGLTLLPLSKGERK